MHQSLHISDIVRLICNQYYEHYSQLLALALTCRSFQEPALEALWNTLHGIDRLIQTCGSGLVKVLTEDDSEEMHLSRHLTESDMAVIRKYACLVRHFHDHLPRTHSNVWSSLKHECRGSPLFPHLQSVNFLEVPEDFLALFDTDNLTSFATSSYQSYQSTTLANFTAQCPLLVSIYLGWERKSGGMDEIIAAIPLWKNLSRFRSYNGTVEFIQALLSSSSLRHLHIGRFLSPEDGSFLLLPSTKTNSTPFPPLERIKIGFSTVPDAVKFIDAFPAIPSLYSWTVDFEKSEMSLPAKWQGLVKSLGKHAGSLRMFKLKDRIYPSDFEVSTTPPKAFFFALASAFSQLTHISIMAYGDYDLVDEDIENLTKALPRLQKFSLLDARMELDGFRLTIGCFVSFARNCPSLIRLGLGFNAESYNIPQRLELSSQNFSVRELKIPHAPVDDLDAVARFIFGIFPHTEHIIYQERINWSHVHTPYGREWSEISRLIAEMRMKRADGVGAD